MLDSLEIDPATGTRITMEARDLAELAYTAAGAATGPLLADHPGYVFPSEKVSERVAEAFFEATGLDVSQIPGYAGVPPVKPPGPPEGWVRCVVDLSPEEVAEADSAKWAGHLLEQAQARLKEQQAG